jgi:3-methylcrotonyl-CoA carboxylase alpha subunit
MHHVFTIDDREFRVWLARDGEGYRAHVDDREYAVSRDVVHDHSFVIDGTKHQVFTTLDGDLVHIWMNGETRTLRYCDPVDYYAGQGAGAGNDIIEASMPGTVIALYTQEGAPVARGDTLLVIESMKLETAIKAPRDGIIATLHVSVGQSFDRAASLVALVPEAEA